MKTRLSLFSLFGFVTLLAISAIPSMGELVRVSCDADTTLFSNGSGNDNMGAFTNGIAGATAVGGTARMLLHFPVEASVPKGAKVTGATLLMTSIRQNATAPASVFAWHRMLKPWVEGRGTGDFGSPALPGEPSWNARSTGTELWGVSGGMPDVDFVNAPSAQLRIESVGRLELVAQADAQSGLLADIQSWVSGNQTNLGWIFLCQEEGVKRTARRFATREGVIEERPVLEVEYEPPTLAPLVLGGIRLQSGVLLFQFQAASGVAYEIEATTSLTPAAWRVVESVPSGQERQVETRVNVGDESVRLIRVRSTQP